MTSKLMPEQIIFDDTPSETGPGPSRPWHVVIVAPCRYVGVHRFPRTRQRPVTCQGIRRPPGATAASRWCRVIAAPTTWCQRIR